ncbi:hypothetical protein C4F51_02695 [Cellvibrio sp. KB43]|uniref:Uncharacterized protein n=1 Tax=Cellvibrio polysaccharolyticus TaxID=2082724 RepID=A0A928UZT1_9GAMM|nr:hypothetical protein [Cellvibrio polysaccharolyticus]
MASGRYFDLHACGCECSSLRRTSPVHWYP